ncbi:FMN-binding protein [candidate division KSB1 bacterium]|nr:FMN-binding protein [candidate division KSB1 bacterium]
MWRLIIFFNASRRGRLPRRIGLVLAVLFISLCAGRSQLAISQVFMKQEEALRHAFPQAEKIERHTLFLTDEQVAEIQKSAHSKVESKVVIYYRATRGEKILGLAFFETMIVRTKPATIMAVINPDSTLQMVEILAFHEPRDYLPAPRWLTLFRNRTLNEALWPKRDIHHISGATLSVQEITLAVRRLLATHIVAVSRELKK